MNMGPDTNSKIVVLSQKVENMLQKLSLLDTFGEKLGKFGSTIQTLATNVEKVTNRIGEVEKGMEFINSQFEENKKDLTKVKKDLTEVKRDVSHIKTENATDTPNEESDATEEVIKKFMTDNLKLDPVVDFHRAHRFGKISEREKPDGSTFMTKPIVCRFKNFKDRETVRKAASNLRGTNYGISEQFPKEINDRRRALWPYFQEARKRKKKAFFKRDRLYIEGNEFIPPPQESDVQDEMMDEEQTQVYEAQGARPKDNQRRASKFPRGGPRNRYN
ncbi:unnamed protein product [Mytilus coruscus]|uniref:Uncharacterized protein n=1 Tax=Mytilus coruscus TaxID=42192 RepID=A0A6J8DVJ4_MYTCO|nr:unnamed protein product [Mytilus coruscus]